MDKDVNILVVEDSPTQAEQLKYLLEKRGYSVRVSVNGLDGLRAARDYEPSLIISDIVMPEMDGYSLCRELKKDERLRDVPFILLTSLSDSRDIIRGLECGADNFIMKPYDEQYLLSRIWHILSNRDLRKTARMQMGVEIFFSGQKYLITSDREQILDLLLATYETAVQKNQELLQTQDELNTLNENLEGIVEERTAALKAEIVERKIAEETSRKQAQLLDLANDAIIVRDFNDSILYWNKGAERLYGWTKEEAQGKSASLLFQAAYPKPRGEIEEQLLRDGHWEGELTQTRRDRSRLTVQTRWTLDEQNGGTPIVLEITSDVTESRLLENHFGRLKKWRPSAGWPEVLRMILITCSPSSWAVASLFWSVFPKMFRLAGISSLFCRAAHAPQLSHVSFWPSAANKYCNPESWISTRWSQTWRKCSRG